MAFYCGKQNIYKLRIGQEKNLSAAIYAITLFGFLFPLLVEVKLQDRYKSEYLNGGLMNCRTVLYGGFLFCSALIGRIDSKELPSPYNQVKLMPSNPQGWHENHTPLQRLIQLHNVRTVVEVGSWLGLSTIDLAQMIPEDGKIYAVDIWGNSTSALAGPPTHYSFPNEPIPPHIIETAYDQFLSNMIHANVAEKVIPMRMESVRAAAILDILADLIYIDASHGYESCYADLTAWHSHLSSHGVICGDDYHWEGIGKAVRTFAVERGLQVFDNGRFWWLGSVPKR